MRETTYNLEQKDKNSKGAIGTLLAFFFQTSTSSVRLSQKAQDSGDEDFEGGFF